MGDSKIHILCPEYVPLENKGEEAIIRGTVDVIFGKQEDACEYHMVDMNIDEYQYVNGLHMHPGKLFFSDWRSREFGLGLSFEQIYSSSCSLLRNFLNKFFPFWIRKPHKEATRLKRILSGEIKGPKKYQESIELLKKVNFIIAGHNGGLDEYVCHILNELQAVKIPYGIFGSSMKPNVKQKERLKIFQKSFENSLFNIARNPLGYKWAIKNFPHCEFELNPDPAFGMFPIDPSEIDEIIQENDLSTLFEKEVIMFTTAEPAPITRHSFQGKIGIFQKTEAHRKFLAELLKNIHKTTDANIIFLPHTIGPNIQMDDRLISKDAIKRAGLDSDERVFLLESDLSAKELKGLISRAEFIVAERVHSIIGAIGVRTPFMSLASDKDTRVQGILREQMDLGELVFSLKNPSNEEVNKKFAELYNDRERIVDKLETLNKRIDKELKPTGKKINEILIKVAK
jgi:polysaccharide pyruvyl transferase WcaK-like protein